MPSWPLIWTYTGGLLGIDQQEQVEEQVRGGARPRAPPGRSGSRRSPSTRSAPIPR